MHYVQAHQSGIRSALNKRNAIFLYHGHFTCCSIQHRAWETHVPQHWQNKDVRIIYRGNEERSICIRPVFYTFVLFQSLVFSTPAQQKAPLSRQLHASLTGPKHALTRRMIPAHLSVKEVRGCSKCTLLLIHHPNIPETGLPSLGETESVFPRQNSP